MAGSNPFADLYVTESIGTEKFAQLFSPVLANESQTHALFQPGNIFLTGLQGSGKTALLSLLRPEVMIAYRRVGSHWPLPESLSRFVAAGINLNTSKARDFGQRMLSDEADPVATNALLFGDFLNYWIVDDLLRSLEVIRDDTATQVYRTLGVQADQTKLDELAKVLACHACWFGSLEDVSTYAELKGAIDGRIYSYRCFLNYNADLPSPIVRSKTSPGEPIGVVAETLKQLGVIRDDVPVFVVVDQFEDLMGLEGESEEATGGPLREVVMKMLSERRQQVSYRIGARPYSLYPDFATFRTGSSAEEMRNFKIIDIGEILGSKEARPGLFKNFCEDVFRRRLSYKGPHSKSLLTTVFGRNEAPEQKARRYVRSNPKNVIRSQDGLADEYRAELAKVAEREPFSARLGVAWVLQQVARKKGEVSLSEIEREPWNEPRRRWWKKERTQQALLQIAANQQQRMKWYGARDVLSLSGRNILVFLSICQFIWAEYRRTGQTTEGDNKPPEGIPVNIQDVGIHDASSYWFRKIKADPNGGDDRHRFISVLGDQLRSGLRNDRRMSYPGETGFSLSERDLEVNEDVSAFLNRCVAYGVLESFRHTAKSKHRGQSRKWYLFPILTPYFQLPTLRTKEPRYLRVGSLRRWLESADRRGVVWKPEGHTQELDRESSSGRQGNLFADLH
ncbi:MAG: hypothetical protein F4X19_06775 [Acidobacteria bacterium]|nr:hypothetical protein [Acidobacteriota bacterium]